MNYKLGWLVEQYVLALTHFTSAISAEEFQAILAETQTYLQPIEHPFHVIIDNRMISDLNIVSLEIIMQAFPALNHKHLSWIVMILPEPIKHTAAERPIQQHETIQLIYVENLQRALDHVQHAEPKLNLSQRDQGFFDQH
ncbi:hypothetical protein ACP8Y2_05875 [Herpetosiphon llansteffanensis]